MYKVVIPFKLRIFYNETNGEVLQPPAEFQARAIYLLLVFCEIKRYILCVPQAADIEPIKIRKPIKQPLMYGTVDTHIFNDTPDEANLRLVDEMKQQASQRYN